MQQLGLWWWRGGGSQGSHHDQSQKRPYPFQDHELSISTRFIRLYHLWSGGIQIMRWITLWTVLLGLAQPGYAVVNQSVPYYQIYQPYVSPRALGMGNAFTAVA